MFITVNNANGTVNFNTAQFDTFRAFLAGGQKIQAIKFVREMLPTWGLREAKEFVDLCTFLPSTLTATVAQDTTFLCDVKDDLRAILVTETQYRESLLIDLFGRVCAKVGLR